MIVKVGNWIDYSTSTTVVGFSSISTKIVRYQRVGDIVVVQFNIQGTSNSSVFTFTVPIVPDSLNLSPWQACQVTNSGTISGTCGAASLISAIGVVTIARTFSGVTFSTSLGKGANGEFWYRVSPIT